MGNLGVFVGVILAAAAFGLPNAEPPANVVEYKVDLVAKVASNQFMGIDADANQLKLVDFRPGDCFTVSRAGNAQLTAEEWEQDYTWETKKKSGGFLGFGAKTTITTHHLPSKEKWNPKWGEEIVAVLTGSDPSDFQVMIGKDAVGKEYRSNTNTGFGGAKVSATVKTPTRTCPRPAGAPGHAKPSGQPSVKALFTDGEKFGSITIRITRPVSED